MIKLEVEGTDGAGKTTALKYLLEKLQQADKKVLETREVGSKLIPACLKLREVVLDPDFNLSGEAMELIFAAMRVENERYYKLVAKNYDFIISDRGWFSHLAYTDHNVDADFTVDFYMDFLEHRTSLPDVVVYLDVEGEVAQRRRKSRGQALDAIEMKGAMFQDKVRDSFKKYMEDYENIVIINVNANLELEEVQKQLDKVVKFMLSFNNKESEF